MSRVAVVTGGDRGIGRACVEALAADGWRVVFTCRERIDLAEALCASLRERGLDVHWMRCDVADAEDVRQIFAEIERTHHRVDALVCNAGVALLRLFQDTDEADWNRLLQVNLLGAVRCDRAVLPGMISRREGAIVHIASMWGEVGASCETAYSAVKAALIGLTKALAKEVGPSGVRVNCVSPGLVRTDMNASLDAETLDAIAEDTPLGRQGETADIAGAVRFLLSKEASFITGQVLGVSGGLVI
ncbi:MAG: 3-oxoacyl-ACP reductase FabG [Clostridia bacterium]|nr:3-oxoacyl-ACP reductase FabG [Clostridia bacterium]